MKAEIIKNSKGYVVVFEDGFSLQYKSPLEGEYPQSYIDLGHIKSVARHDRAIKEGNASKIAPLAWTRYYEGTSHTLRSNKENVRPAIDKLAKANGLTATMYKTIKSVKATIAEKQAEAIKAEPKKIIVKAEAVAMKVTKKQATPKAITKAQTKAKATRTKQGKQITKVFEDALATVTTR